MFYHKYVKNIQFLVRFIARFFSKNFLRSGFGWKFVQKVVPWWQQFLEVFKYELQCWLSQIWWIILKNVPSLKKNLSIIGNVTIFVNFDCKIKILVKESSSMIYSIKTFRPLVRFTIVQITNWISIGTSLNVTDSKLNVCNEQMSN